MPNQINTPIPYLILDGQDGSAGLILFKTIEARDLYLERCDDEGNMSDSAFIIDQNDLDTALDIDAVRAQFSNNLEQNG